MKKTLIFFLIVLMLSMVGCKSAGKAIAMPSDPTEAGFGVERALEGNTVTLTVYKQAIPSNEIIIIADKIPEGFSYVEGSASIAPMFNDNTLLVWLFAENPPTQIGVTTVRDQTPTSITYRTNLAPSSDTQFRGKWGLKQLNIEGVIGKASDRVTIGILDLLKAIQDYKDGRTTILNLLSFIEQYKRSL